LSFGKVKPAIVNAATKQAANVKAAAVKAVGEKAVVNKLKEPFKKDINSLCDKQINEEEKEEKYDLDESILAKRKKDDKKEKCIWARKTVMNIHHYKKDSLPDELVHAVIYLYYYQNKKDDFILDYYQNSYDSLSEELKKQYDIIEKITDELQMITTRYPLQLDHTILHIEIIVDELLKFIKDSKKDKKLTEEFIKVYKDRIKEIETITKETTDVNTRMLKLRDIYREKYKIELVSFPLLLTRINNLLKGKNTVYFSS
jgi:hypothetical protein